MAAKDAALPPSGPADNGEEVLLDEGDAPAVAARAQAEQMTGQRRPSGGGNSPARKEGQRQHETSDDS
jgi:hypothetical protein